MGFADDVLYTLRANHKGEAVAHAFVRTAFLQDIAADPRTQLLFEVWREQYRFDEMIAAARQMLDRAAVASRVDSRAVFRPRHDGTHRSLLDAVGDPEEQRLLREVLEHVESRLVDTRQARADDAPRFIMAELFSKDHDTAVSICGGLGSDLLTIFDEDIWCRVWGTPFQVHVPLSPVVGDVPKGQRPHDGARLARDAHWYYLAEVHEPRITVAELARDYASELGVDRAPKDGDRRQHRPDTKAVRAGIRRAAHLLTLPVPPDLWSEFFTFGRVGGGKTRR